MASGRLRQPTAQILSAETQHLVDRVLDVIDADQVPLADGQTDDVEADRPAMRKHLQVVQTQLAQFSNLAGVHRFLWQAEAVACPGLDLDKDQGAAVDGHQVQLAEGRADISANDLVAEATQVVLGQRLAANP